MHSKMKLVMVASFLALAACGPGEQGPAGPPGPKGDPGAAGSGLVSVAHCNGFIDVTGTGSGWGLTLDVYGFSDGSVLASCIVGGGNVDTSSVAMYKGGTVGASNGGCVVIRDNEGDGTSGIWVFTASADRTSASASYQDPGSSLDKRSQSLSCVKY